MAKEYKLAQTKEQIQAKLNNIPSATGTEGQMISLDENGNPIWKTPATGGIETITITLSTEDGEGDVSNQEVVVNVEGENVPRSLTTDSQGKVTTKVSHGLQYTITFPTIEGYQSQANLVYRASLNVRPLTIQYKVDSTASVEHVIVTLKYQGGDGTSKATTINVVYDNTNHEVAVVSNVAEFDIPLGKAYRVESASVNSYAKPVNQSFTARLHTRKVTSIYFGSEIGLSWLKTDGTTIGIIELTAEMESSIFGLRVADSVLIEANSVFVIPIKYLLGELSVDGKQWCTQSVQFDCIPNIGNRETAILAANADGENNTLSVLEEAERKGLSVPLFTACHNLEFTIGDRTINGFAGSYKQMETFGKNRDSVNSITSAVLGKSVIAINSGLWWTSTQGSATNGVKLNNGGFNGNGNKTSSNSVVPFCAY